MSRAGFSPVRDGRNAVDEDHQTVRGPAAQVMAILRNVAITPQLATLAPLYQPRSETSRWTLKCFLPGVTRPIDTVLTRRYRGGPVNILEGSLADMAYASLRHRITSLELAPGSGLTEGAVAAELGLSKTPVREALMRLRLEGLVTMEPGGGYTASPVTIEDTCDFFTLRALLEGETARLAAGRSLDDEDRTTLQDLCTSSYLPGDPTSIDAFLAHNTRFHMTIGRAGGNRRLVRLLDVVLVEMERLFRIGLLLTVRSDEIVHEHQALVDAILAGNERVAQQLAVAQVRTSERMVLDALHASSSVITTPITLPASKEFLNGSR